MSATRPNAAPGVPAVERTNVEGVLLLAPAVFADPRGAFFESYNARAFEAVTGAARSFVQDNQSISVRNVLRGLHYQIERPQGKLVRAIVGEVFDVAVDLRRSSPTFGRWTAVRLSSENRLMLWIPEGCAHGFLALSEHAELLYKTTDYYAPEHERSIVWNDPDLAIAWPVEVPPILSARDARGARFRDAELFA
jgi:dTDP-4-dehydrorhamnose 3,5-epimerase